MESLDAIEKMCEALDGAEEHAGGKGSLYMVPIPAKVLVDGELIDINEIKWDPDNWCTVIIAS